MTLKAETIVVGCGGVGSAALYQLARRGVKAIGIDRWEPPHKQGSTHGQTRMIRQAYFEHPDYVPLLLRSYALWETLEAETKQSLLVKSGVLMAGPQGSEILAGVRGSAERHKLTVENLSPSEAMRCYPALAIPEDFEVAFEPAAGYLYVEACVEAHFARAKHVGCTFRFGERVVSWSATPKSVVVQTDRERYEAESLVIAGGSWSASLLADLGLPLRVLRKHLHWFPTDRGEHAAGALPGYFFDLPQGAYYGFPSVGEEGVKLAEHSGGEEIADPDQVWREIDQAERSRVIAFARQHLPGLGEPGRHETCLYTMSPDGHFIVDRHPHHPRVAFAAGLSGHGFKLAPALGEALADYAVLGRTSLPTGFLRLKRLRA
ncbi:MAG TPA: N-methyl-L-tryptophan oxidase [Pirellulaceae bacterium]|jgi:sarcosine oxidase|nr:N-methyl-L-tryptophan oxidase [Pirellulaceae bacterium]